MSDIFPFKKPITEFFIFYSDIFLVFWEKFRKHPTLISRNLHICRENTVHSPSDVTEECSPTFCKEHSSARMLSPVIIRILLFTTF